MISASWSMTIVVVVFAALLLRHLSAFAAALRLLTNDVRDARQERAAALQAWRERS